MAKKSETSARATAAAAAADVASDNSTAQKKSFSLSSFLSSSCAASVFMVVYVGFAMMNLYGLMYPLSRVETTLLKNPNNLIHPLYEPNADLAMKVYLSTFSKFAQDFLASEIEVQDENDDTPPPQQSTILLWKQPIDKASLSKSFLLSSLECISATDRETGGHACNMNERSLKHATDWLDHQDHLQAAESEGLLSTIQSAAGHGIESTSILLTVYQSLKHKLASLLQSVGILKAKDDETNNSDKSSTPKYSRTNVHLPEESPLWQALQHNATVYIHVVVTRQRYYLESPTSLNQAALTLGQANRANALLLGQVDLIKYEVPHHIQKPGRILYQDLLYFFRRYILQQKDLTKPWDMAVMKPEYHQAHERAQQMKLEGKGYPYWKPEVSIKYLSDQDAYPTQLAHVSGMDLVRVQGKQDHPTNMALLPVLHVDEMGMTSDKYIPVNSTVKALPLRISFDRSDVVDDTVKKTTATAGGISPARWRLLTHLSRSLESQRELGFEQSDIDDLRRLIADTNVALLGITVLASALHLLFEFLTFKNEVSFWKNNSDLTGLSVRSLFLDMIGQFIIVLYLIDKDSSLLMTVPSAIGVLIALWKCQRAAGLVFVKMSPADKNKPAAFYNVLPRLFGYELRATRLETKPRDDKTDKKSGEGANSRDLQTLTIEADRQATSRLGSVLLPMVLVYTLYSLVMEEHISWYSWLITSASSAVYAFGFVLMTPQLFLNYKMKSVAHLPWRVLVYKSLNTFIDDLFSFIIRMPTMARISCFRDDVVFFIYLYQRWLYPVDASRPVEGGGDGMKTASDGSKNATVSDTKKKQ